MALTCVNMWNILEFQMAHGGLVANSENNFSVLMRCKFGWKEYNYDRLDIWINGSLTKAKVDLIFKSILKNISNANTDYSSINEIVNSIKGSFALIIRSEQWIYAACDKVKSIPVSFVIVNNHINLNEVSSEIMVVPTIQEAKDIVEMEIIERELGM